MVNVFRPPPSMLTSALGNIGPDLYPLRPDDRKKYPPLFFPDVSQKANIVLLFRGDPADSLLQGCLTPAFLRRSKPFSMSLRSRCLLFI